MTEDTITIGGDMEDIPPGTYPATLASLTIKQSVAFGDFRAWDFTLVSGQTVGGATSMKAGKKSKAGRWITSLLGKLPDKGTTLSASDLIGKPCLVVVEENGDGWPTVTNVLPPMAANSGPVTAVPAGAAPPAPAVAPPISEDLPF